MPPREYICCSGKSCAGWIWADKAQPHMLCKKCRTLGKQHPKGETDLEPVEATMA